jgi:hypothetical protein
MWGRDKNFGPSVVRALPLAAGINEGGHYFAYIIATLGLSWNFSLSEILASLCLQDRPQSGNIITEPASQPASHPASQPTAYIEICYIFHVELYGLVGSSSNF